MLWLISFHAEIFYVYTELSCVLCVLVWFLMFVEIIMFFTDAYISFLKKKKKTGCATDSNYAIVA